MKQSRWLRYVLATSLIVGSIVISSAGPSAAAGGLEFVAPGPQDAGVSDVIGTADYDPTGGFQVQVVGGGSQSARIKVEIDLPNSPDPESGAALIGNNEIRASGGIATFNLRISKHGQYALIATANNLADGHSASFRIWDQVCGEGEPCPVGQIKKGSTVPEENMTASITSTSGLIAMSLGDDSINCDAEDAEHGVTFNHAPSTVTLFATEPDVEKSAFISISRDWDTLVGDPPGAAHYQVCYVDDLEGWTDLFGDPVAVGQAAYLPDCAPGQGAPCVQSRTKENRSRNVLLVVLLRDARMK